MSNMTLEVNEQLTVGPWLAAVVAAQAATAGLLGTSELREAAAAVCRHASARGCGVLAAADPGAERLVGAALMLSDGELRVLFPGEDPTGLKILVIDVVVAAATQLETLRQSLLAQGAAHVEIAVRAVLGPLASAGPAVMN